jgi:hypothetical protein
MRRMRIHMGYCCCLAGSTGSRHGSWLGSRSCRGMRGEGGLSTSHHTRLTPHPRPEGGHGRAGTNIVGIELLK